jgi:maltooligosyltrehalose synthase
LAGIDWMVIAARYPLDKQYVALQFQDVYQAEEYIPMSHAGNIPHRVLAFEVGTAQARWAATHHPLLHFMCGTHHQDIMIFGPEAIEVLSKSIPRQEATLPVQVKHGEAVSMN